MGNDLNWEVSIKELVTPEGIRYKVARRMPELAIAETKIFIRREDAISQCEVWLD